MPAGQWLGEGFASDGEAPDELCLTGPETQFQVDACSSLSLLDQWRYFHKWTVMPSEGEVEEEEER